MYPRPFQYHRASSLTEAVAILHQLGEEAKFLAGGQSLIPLMKLRLASPKHLVDLNFIPGLSYIREDKGTMRFGALTRHREIENSEVAAKIAILHDCAGGIADVQVRNRGTIGGSVAEADPSGDWITALSVLPTTLRCRSGKRERTLRLDQFVKDAYTTALAKDELVTEIVVKLPPPGSGSAYVAFKRAAPVYPTASAAVHLTMEGDVCQQAAIALGSIGLTAIRPGEAETILRGQKLNQNSIAKAVEAVRAAVDPQADVRGSAEYKRRLVGSLVKQAIDRAARRARGESVEGEHIYA